MTIFDVEELWTHGGSLRIYARHADRRRPPVERAGARAARARGGGRLPRRRDLRALRGAGAGDQAQAARAADRRSSATGKTIVGYGAPGKGNTLLNYCGIRTDFIDFTVDRNPYKQGRFLPGTHIPIHAPERIDEVKPDYILILPWNFKDEILDAARPRREWGAQFIVPIPEADGALSAAARRSAPSRSRRCTMLCLGAHSDDIEIGCGGTMLRLLAERPGSHGALGGVLGRRRARARGAGERRRLPRRRRRRPTSRSQRFRESYFPYVGAEIKDFFNELRQPRRARRRVLPTAATTSTRTTARSPS